MTSRGAQVLAGIEEFALSNRSKIDQEIFKTNWHLPCASLLEIAQLELHARKRLQHSQMNTIEKHQAELTEWAFDTIKEKAKFDLSKLYGIQTDTMINEYIEDCSYSLTVILRKSSVMTVQHAQERLHSSFNNYNQTVLGPQCMDLGKLTSRNRQFLPLTFLAIDIEGTRHNAFDVVTTDPHGHGVIMFDTRTVFNFRKANARSLREDGSYEIVNPTREIALIKLVPFRSIVGVGKFLHYSLKYAAKLKGNQANFRPYDFFPPTLVNYPFWKYLAGTARHSYDLESVGDDERDALKRVWNLDHTDSSVSRHVGRGRGGTADRHSPI